MRAAVSSPFPSRACETSSPSTGASSSRLGAERTLAVATSAVRDAENGEAFLGEVEWSYGFATRLLTGDEEAALTLRGVGPLEPGTVVVDVGGGSTELITEGFRTSLDIGSVRLTERHGADWDALAAEIRSHLPELTRTPPARRRRDDRGTGGPRRGHAPTASKQVLDWLRTSTDAERRARLLQPDRSDVIAAGVLIVREVLRQLRPRPDRPVRARPPGRRGARGGGARRTGRRRGTPGRLHLLLNRDICGRNFLLL